MKPLIISCFLAFIGLIAVTYLYNYWGSNYHYTEISGSFLSALYTGLALVFLIFGVSLQFLEVKALIKQNEASAKHAKILEDSLRERDEKAHLKDKEATFLSLFNLYLNLRNDTNLIGKSKTDYNEFSDFSLKIMKEFNRPEGIITGSVETNLLQTTLKNSELSNQEKISHLVEFRYSSNFPIIRPVITAYKTLIDYLDKEFITKQEKEVAKHYLNLIRDSITYQELDTILLVGLTKEHADLKVMIEKYGLLRAIYRNHEVFKKFENLYDQRAFNKLDK